MTEPEEPAKVTTESSEKVLKAVAGRLAKIEAGEMPELHYVGADGVTESVISHTGEVAKVPADAAPAAEPDWDAMAELAAQPLPHAAPVAKEPGWQPSLPPAEPRKGFFARLLAKLRGNRD